jgi:hypothetical protein
MSLSYLTSVGQLLSVHLLSAVREEVLQDFMAGDGAALNFAWDLLLDGGDHFVLDHDCALVADAETD